VEIALTENPNASRLDSRLFFRWRDAHAKVLMLSGIGDEAELRRLAYRSSSIFPVWDRTSGSFWYRCVWSISNRSLPATMEASNVLLEEQSWS